MDWTDLRLLLALWTHGNLKAAARALALDYSTVWRHVQRLEAAAGGRLFVRVRGSVQPTALGRELAYRAREIERLLEASRGRALCLFTNWSGLQQVHNRLKDESSGVCWPMQAQGDAPRYSQTLDSARR